MLDIQFPSKYEDENQANILKEVYYNQILPQLEKIADEYCGPETLVRIDLLEINLGKLPLYTLQYEFSEKVEKAFREKLKQTVAKNYEDGKNSQKSIFAKQSAFEILNLFLKTGDLPWWVSTRQTLNINNLLLEVQKQNPAELKHLLIELSIFPDVIERIKKQFDHESLKVIEQILYNSLNILESYIKTGDLPWWISTSRTFSINSLLLEAQKQNPAELKQLLFELSDIPDISERIHNKFDNEALKVIEQIMDNHLFILEFYLKTGDLPPLIKSKETINPDNLIKTISTKNRKELEILIISLSIYPDVIIRIQNQFNNESILLITQLLNLHLPVDHQNAFDDLGIICESSPLINISSYKYRLLALPILGKEGSGQISVSEFLGKIIFILAEEQKKSITDFYLELFLFISDNAKLNLEKYLLRDLLIKTGGKEQEQLKSLFTAIPLGSLNSDNLINILLGAYQSTIANLPLNQSPALSDDEKQWDENNSSIPLVLSKATKEELIDLSSINAEKVKLPKINESYIDNAGTVILWPYLYKFFEHLHYVKQGKFINIKTKKRAIHMLHFLVWNEEHSPEYRLLLNKILCGYEISKPIELKVKFTKDEKKSAIELLEAVVENWPILKNTSADGLCETFLQRNGVLTLKDDNWTLRVEQKTVDMLMEQLPWSINIIKLPWMNQILYVEW